MWAGASSLEASNHPVASLLRTRHQHTTHSPCETVDFAAGPTNAEAAATRDTDKTSFMMRLTISFFQWQDGDGSSWRAFQSDWDGQPPPIDRRAGAFDVPLCSLVIMQHLSSSRSVCPTQDRCDRVLLPGNNTYACDSVDSTFGFLQFPRVMHRAYVSMSRTRRD